MHILSSTILNLQVLLVTDSIVKTTLDTIIGSIVVWHVSKWLGLGVGTTQLART